jgi:hypothetical protein
MNPRKFAMNRSVWSLCLIVPVFTCSPVLGQQPKTAEDAAIERVVTAGLEANRKLDWEKYAGLVHPKSLEQYKAMWLPVLKAAAKPGDLQQADVLPLFDKATDLPSVIALKPKEFFVRSMKGLEPQFRDAMGNLQTVEEKILGTVHEGSNDAFVVVRIKMKNGAAETSRVEVIGLKRSGTEWELMLPDVVRTMAAAFGGDARVETSGSVTENVQPEK